MVDVTQIIQGAVARTNTYISKILDREVTFGQGLYTQAGNDLKPVDKDRFLFIWFMSPYDIVRTNKELFGEYVGDLIIGMDTDENYTDAERDQNSYNPVLYPVYDRFMLELDNSSGIHHDHYPHTLRKAPFWGLGDVNGHSTPNIWKTNADCLIIKDLRLKIPHPTDANCAKTI